MLENLMKFKYEAKCSLSVSSENHSMQTLLGCCTADQSVKSLRLRRPTGCPGIHLSAGTAGTLSQRLGRQQGIPSPKLPKLGNRCERWAYRLQSGT